MNFQTTIDEADGLRWMRLGGRLDSVTSEGFRQQVDALFESGGPGLMLDLSDLDYISSAGLRVVLMAAKTARRQASPLVLFGLQRHVREVFEVSGFLKILVVCHDRAAALEAATRHASDGPIR